MELTAELNVSGEITRNDKIPRIIALYQTLKTTKMNLLQVCPSVPSIVFALLYICLDLLKRG